VQTAKLLRSETLKIIIIFSDFPLKLLTSSRHRLNFYTFGNNKVLRHIVYEFHHQEKLFHNAIHCTKKDIPLLMCLCFGLISLAISISRLWKNLSVTWHSSGVKQLTEKHWSLLTRYARSHPPVEQHLLKHWLMSLRGKR